MCVKQRDEGRDRTGQESCEKRQREEEEVFKLQLNTGRPGMLVHSWWLLTTCNSILDEPINYLQTDRIWWEKNMVNFLKVMDEQHSELLMVL